MPDQIPGSDQSTITTVELALEAMLNKFVIEQPDLKFVFDDQLSYDTSVAKYRTDNNLEENAEITFPLFAWRRSVLRHSERAPGRRMGRMLVRQATAGMTNVVRSVHGEFELEFLYISPEVQRIERFEVTYLAEEGLSGDKELNVTLPAEFDSKIFPYYVEHGLLTEKQFNTEGNFFKTLAGTMIIRGHYLVLRAQQRTITEINARIKDLMGPGIVYSTMQIVP